MPRVLALPARLPHVDRASPLSVLVRDLAEGSVGSGRVGMSGRGVRVNQSGPRSSVDTLSANSRQRKHFNQTGPFCSAPEINTRRRPPGLAPYNSRFSRWDRGQDCESTCSANSSSSGVIRTATSPACRLCVPDHRPILQPWDRRASCGLHAEWPKWGRRRGCDAS